MNNQAVYDPGGRLIEAEAASADLQGCINIALQQQGLQDAAELTVLSCPGAGIAQLDNIGRLTNLRFLDLGNNLVRNITPLEALRSLSGLNLANNQVDDIATLLNLDRLASVNLSGNTQVPCRQLDRLQQRLGADLQRPASCND